MVSLHVHVREITWNSSTYFKKVNELSLWLYKWVQIFWKCPKEEKQVQKWWHLMIDRGFVWRSLFD